MNKKTRTENVAKNVAFSTFFQILAYILGFVSRTIFIKILGKEYLGLDGVFTNVLTLLSFAELGVGSAIIYSMYKPLAEDNKAKLRQLTEFYKKIYFTIGIVVLIVGVVLIPFLKFFITSAPSIKENIIVIYLLFVINSSISYFYSYRTSILSADQKHYLLIVYNKLFHIVQVIVQIVVIILFHNYYLYLIIQIICTLSANICLSIKSKRTYPSLANTKGEKLPVEEKKSILNNVKSLIIYKIGGVALNGTDNLIISRYLTLAVAGIYSNYQLLTNAVVEVIGQITYSFTASVGNLNNSESVKHKEEVFYKLLYFTYLLFGVACITISLVINDFVNIWIGKKYLLDFITVLAIVSSIYINGVQYASFSYRNTLGLFNEAKLGPILAVILNIILSIVLAKTIGLCGVFFATAISRFLSYGIIDPVIVYKNEFKKSPINYYLKYFKYIILVLISMFMTYYIVKFIPVYNILFICLKAIACVVVSTLLLVVFTIRTKEFIGIKYNLKTIFNKIIYRGIK